MTAVSSSTQSSAAAAAAAQQSESDSKSKKTDEKDASNEAGNAAAATAAQPNTSNTSDMPLLQSALANASTGGSTPKWEKWDVQSSSARREQYNGKYGQNPFETPKTDENGNPISSKTTSNSHATLQAANHHMKFSTTEKNELEYT